MIYSFSADNRGSKFLDIEFTIENNKEEEVFIQLPAWRPGRYELGNFAKNIQKFEVRSMNNKPLPFQKVTKDKWKIEAGKIKKFKIVYNYYANELNAGSTWIDDNQVYVNPVNCCLYVVGREHEPIRLFFNNCNHKQAAISLQKIGDHFVAESFDELADSPFILSDSLQHNSYDVQGTKFNIWFQGECRPPWKRIIKDFKAFTKEQLKVFGSFPFDEYHFFYQILPYQAYHGVEHLKNTVISFGPGYSVFEGENYEEFLGVSSHELFHAWNVKTIRPADMVPYDFTKENYTRMGYLTEGVTTYYGDLALFDSEVFTETQFLKQINKTLDRHFLNYGVENLSVADSSFDTWIDGYQKGIPNRKSSIYTEGSLLAMIIDLKLKTSSKGELNLGIMMKDIFRLTQKKGLSENEFLKFIEKLLGKDAKKIWEENFNSKGNYLSILTTTFKEAKIKFYKKECTKYLATHYGCYLQNNTSEITLIAPNSPAVKAGLNVGDEILAINDIEIQKGNADLWANYFKGELKLLVKKDRLMRTIKLTPSSKSFFSSYNIKNWTSN